MSTVTELRPPDGVPAAARFVPGGTDTFEALQAVQREHRAQHRSLLRVSAPFVLWRPRGVLREVLPRALTIARRPGRSGTVLLYNTGDPVPGVWVWTLQDERADDERAQARAEGVTP